ncbi:MAG: phosphotransferase [Candidatus Pacebacteria bacterium]|nr:phosphotransferase [Candidatus Paceibacterota bacterium]
MAVYSKRLGDITNEQLQKALDRFSLGKLVNAEKISFGNFGQNVFVYSDKGEFVLRGCPHNPQQFESEKFIVDQIHQNTKVPVPFPYLYDDTADIFGWSYILMPKMPGIQLADSEVQKKLSTEDKRGIAIAMAKNLLELHKLTWNFPGQYDLQKKTVKPFAEDFFMVIKNRLINFVDKSLTHNNCTTKEDKIWLENLINDGEEAIRLDFIPAIIMQDYKQGNAVATKKDGVWRISGIFDLQEWYFGDSEIDLYRTASCYVDDANYECLGEYLNTYLSQKQIRPGFKKRLPVYVMLDRMIIWEWAQRNKNVWWDKSSTLRQWGEPFVNKILEAVKVEK